jgi:AcrR family transcriptional regulator
MGRSKTISDNEALGRLLATVQAVGPDALSFSKASAAVGLSAATLVQRFGTRDRMIEAVLLHAWDRLASLTAIADAEAPLTPGGAISLLLRLTPGREAEYDVTEGLLLLREDLRNPVLRGRGQAWGDYLAKALGRRLTAQVELTEQTGWQMLAIWQGAIIWLAFKRDTDPEAAIAAVLKDWCRSVGIV